MYRVKESGAFAKDYKLAIRRRLEVSELKKVVDVLAAGMVLDAGYRDHWWRGGKYKDCRECHIQPDWLLVYRRHEGQKVLELVRTGTHSDLM
jgi:mRNA interferase YafQ